MTNATNRPHYVVTTRQTNAGGISQEPVLRYMSFLARLVIVLCVFQ